MCQCVCVWLVVGGALTGQSRVYFTKQSTMHALYRVARGAGNAHPVSWFRSSCAFGSFVRVYIFFRGRGCMFNHLWLFLRIMQHVYNYVMYNVLSEYKGTEGRYSNYTDCSYTILYIATSLLCSWLVAPPPALLLPTDLYVHWLLSRDIIKE